MVSSSSCDVIELNASGSENFPPLVMISFALMALIEESFKMASILADYTGTLIRDMFHTVGL